MSKNRTRLTLLLGLTILFLAINIAVSQIKQYLQSKPKYIFSGFKKDQISEIIFFDNGKVTPVFNKNGLWIVKKDSKEFRGDQDRINAIISTILSLQKNDIVSSNVKKQKDLGIGNQKIELKTKKNSYTIYIGNPAGAAKYYIRIGDDKDVFTAAGFTDAFYPQDYRDLMPHLLDDENKVTKVTIETPDKSFSLEKKGKDWKIGDRTAKKDRVNFFLNDLKTLKAKDIAPESLKPTGAIVLTIIIKEGQKEKTAKFHINDSESYYLEVSESKITYQIQNADLTSLKKEEKDFGI